jgi:hypothetical protein
MGAGFRLICILIHGSLGDRIEGIVYIFCRLSRSGRPLRTYPREKPGTAHRLLTRPLANGAWRTVRDLSSNEKARRLASRIRVPCR